MRTVNTIAALMVLAVAAPAQAQRRGRGSGEWSDTAPVTKDGGGLEMRGARDLAVDPRHGMMGAPGAAQDREGSSRLGPHGERSSRSSYGEAAPGAGESYEFGKSGDRVRSVSSADVRAARQQQAPDLEWADSGTGTGTGTKAGPPQPEPQTPYGTKAQQGQPQKR